MTIQFRMQLLALIGINAVAAFTVEAASGMLVALIRKHRPPPPLELKYAPQKAVAAAAAGMPVHNSTQGGALHSTALPVLPSTTADRPSSAV